MRHRRLRCRSIFKFFGIFPSIVQYFSSACLEIFNNSSSNPVTIDKSNTMLSEICSSHVITCSMINSMRKYWLINMPKHTLVSGILCAYMTCAVVSYSNIGHFSWYTWLSSRAFLRVTTQRMQAGFFVIFCRKSYQVSARLNARFVIVFSRSVSLHSE